MDSADDNLVIWLAGKIARREELTVEEKKQVEQFEQSSPENKQLVLQLFQYGERVENRLSEDAAARKQRSWEEISRRLGIQDAQELSGVHPPGRVRGMTNRRWVAAAVVIALLGGSVFLLFHLKGGKVGLTEGDQVRVEEGPKGASASPKDNGVVFTVTDHQKVRTDSVPRGATIYHTALMRVKAENKDAASISAVDRLGGVGGDGEVDDREDVASAGTEPLAQVETPEKRKPYCLTLPDGTSIWLAAGTTFTIPAKRGDTADLNGEAWFDVHKQASKAFTIRTASGGVVNVLGTTFRIKADKQQSLVALYNGKLKVSYQHQDCQLGKDSELVQGKDGIVKQKMENPSAPIDWLKHAQFFEFDHTPLDSALRVVAGLYDLTIDNPLGLAGQPFTSDRILRSWPAEQVLATLQNIQNDKVCLRLEGTVIRVSDKPSENNLHLHH